MNIIKSVHLIQDPQNLPFSKEEYSSFKYGSKSVAREYGYSLFIHLKQELLTAYGSHLEHMPQLVICSPPYNHIPTAAGAMTDYLVEYLNEFLAGMNKPVCQRTKVHRNHSYIDDYGVMTKKERMKLIGGDKFHIDAEFIHCKHIIFVDDIRITGSHEQVMSNMLKERGIILGEWCTWWFCYYAVLSNDKTHPSIENKLNHASVDHVTDLIPLFAGGDFILNTRVVKFLLKSRPYDFKLAIVTLQVVGGTSSISALYHLALGNSYHLIPEYKDNFKSLKLLIDEYNKARSPQAISA